MSHRVARRRTRPLTEQQAREIVDATAEQLIETMAPYLTPEDAAEMRGPLGPILHAQMRDGLADGADGWVDDDLLAVQPWGFELSSIRVPVLLWQGRQDAMVPFGHGEWLARPDPRGRRASVRRGLSRQPALAAHALGPGVAAGTLGRPYHRIVRRRSWNRRFAAPAGPVRDAGCVGTAMDTRIDSARAEAADATRMDTMGMDTTARDEHSTVELVRIASDQISRLVRAELQLAKAELPTRASGPAWAPGCWPGPAWSPSTAWACSSPTFVLLLALVLPAWASALIVAGVLFALAAVLVLVGRASLKRGLPPVPTVDRRQRARRPGRGQARRRRPAPVVTPGPDLSRQREEVAAQREELGRTISELAERVDVPARARQQSARLKVRLRDAGPDLVLGAVALGSAVVATFAIARWLREPTVPSNRPYRRTDRPE